MRKLFYLISAIIISLTASATDLWTGSKAVTWGAGLQIAASEFAAATPGQKIVLHYSDATDGLELKVMNANFDHLAGSREELGISGNGTVEQFLTQAAVDSLKLYGLELIGANFTATKVELLDGKTLKEGITVWTGYFWADSWSTLALYYNGYAGVDFNKIAAIRFYSEAESGDFDFNFRSAWEEEGYIADRNNVNVSIEDGYLNLNLDDEMRGKLAAAGHLLVQYNRDGKSIPAFNVTDIVLIPNPEPQDQAITPYGDPQHDGVYYSTFFDSSVKYALPAGVEAYVATRDGANLLLSKIANAGDVIPENNAVILKATVASFTLTPSDAEAVPVNAINHLQGSDESIATPENCYVLAGTDGVVGFYHYTAANLNAHKAYVVYSGSLQAPRRMPFIFDAATGVENVQGDKIQSTKIIENGQVIIIRNGVRYNAAGQTIK